MVILSLIKSLDFKSLMNLEPNFLEALKENKQRENKQYRKQTKETIQKTNKKLGRDRDLISNQIRDVMNCDLVK